LLGQAELGKKMAQTLLSEIEVLPELPAIRSEEIVHEVPANLKFYSYQRSNETIYPAKVALHEALLNNEDLVYGFCCVSLTLELTAELEVDHVFPRKLIQNKQIQLLQYLNEASNSTVSASFLGEGEYATDTEHAAAIGKFFKRKANNQIVATRLFFDACVNSVNNLFYLKNYLNRGKSANEPRDWFTNNLPKKLLNDLIASGDVHDGIIMQQVFPVVNSDGSELEHVVWDGRKIYLHDTNSIGLGTFVRNWFANNKMHIIAFAKEINNASTLLTDMLKDYVDADELIARNKRKNLDYFLQGFQELDTVLKTRNRKHTESSSSGSDSQETRKERGTNFYSKLAEVFKYMHKVKKLRDFVLTKVIETDKEIVHKEFYAYCRAHNMNGLTIDTLEAAGAYFHDLVSLCDNISAQDVNRLLLEAQSQFDPEMLLEETRKQLEEREKETRKQLEEARKQLEEREEEIRKQLEEREEETRKQLEDTRKQLEEREEETRKQLEENNRLRALLASANIPIPDTGTVQTEDTETAERAIKQARTEKPRM
jgi:hypothetical protein